MSLLDDIAEALAAQIKDHVSRDVTVIAYPDLSADLPSVQVWPAGNYVDPWMTYGGSGRATVNLRIRVETSNQDGATAMRVLNAFLSPGSLGESSSIVDAVMSDTTLGGVVESCVPVPGGTEIDPDAATYNHVAFIDVEVILKKDRANA